jgi:hypothetical protein
VAHHHGVAHHDERLGAKLQLEHGARLYEPAAALGGSRAVACRGGE